MSETTGEQILNLPMGNNDSGACTIRGYLGALLRELWNEGEGFSGKRPFGNSGWEYDLFLPLLKAGFIDGKLDEYGFIDEVDETAGFELIFRAIDALIETSADVSTVTE